MRSCAEMLSCAKVCGPNGTTISLLLKHIDPRITRVQACTLVPYAATFAKVNTKADTWYLTNAC